MDEAERAQIKRWVETWRKAGPALAAIEREELRRMTDDERRRAIEAVMSLAPVCTEPRPTSGLVEQQRRFAKFRR